MHRLRTRHLSALLLTLTLVSASAALAQDEKDPRLLKVGQLQLVQELDFSSDSTAMAGRKPTPIAEAQTISIHDPDRLTQISTQQTTAGSGDGKLKRTGRWMKKHWWAPTLIGVAVGVLLLEPFDDDDDERRRAQPMNP